MDDHTFIGESLSLYEPSMTLTLEERLNHTLIIGSTGSGKSTAFRHIAAQDIARGDGVLVLDAHGDLAEEVLSDIPPWRHNHVCALSLADVAHPIAINILEDTHHPDDRAFVVDVVVAAKRAIWHDSWGARLENVLRHSCRVLLETDGASLALLPRLLTDDAFRKVLVARCSDPYARAFFGKRYETWRDAFRDEAIEPVLNKVEAFLAFPSIRNILGQARSSLHLTHAMNEGRIVIVNLASGIVGETPARLFGALMVAQLRAAAMSRARLPKEERRPFHIFLDEAQAYGSGAVVSLLSETRKYATSVIIGTQFLDALDDTTRSALLGNVGTLVVFRCGPADAAVLAPHFDDLQRPFNPVALQNQATGEAWVNGISVRIPEPRLLGDTETVKKQSRRHYAHSRESVERKIFKALGHTPEDL